MLVPSTVNAGMRQLPVLPLVAVKFIRSLFVHVTFTPVFVWHAIPASFGPSINGSSIASGTNWRGVAL